MNLQATIRVVLAPSLLFALISTGCGNDVLRALNNKTDEFTQNTAAQVDILWVVDNSESMAEEQQGLGESFQAFVGNLVQSGVDYHIGVISTDVGDGGVLHVASGQPAFIDRDTSDPTAAFLANVRVGTGGSRQEKGFEVAATAIGKGIGWQPCTPANPPPGCDADPVVTPNPGFLRRGYCDPFNVQTAGNKTCEGTTDACDSHADCDPASLFLIFVSDEDDKSFGPVRYYWRVFDAYHGAGNEALVKVSAIVGPVAGAGSSDPDGCFDPARGSAQAGYRYIDLVSQAAGANTAEGIVASICSDFNEALTNLSITAAGLSSKFPLSSLPNINARIPCNTVDTAAFCVTVNGTAIPQNRTAGWIYDESDNTIAFGAQALPPPQAKITVTYQSLR